MEWVKYICAILAGISTCIPLAIKLVEAVRTAVREKNWRKVVLFVLDRMKEAEDKFDTGEERKEWVIMCVKAAADTFEYDVDLDAVAQMIDAFAEMSKAVNAPTEAVVENV